VKGMNYTIRDTPLCLNSKIFLHGTKNRSLDEEGGINHGEYEFHIRIFRGNTYNRKENEPKYGYRNMETKLQKETVGMLPRKRKVQSKDDKHPSKETPVS
jgi:hypothetical protein